MLCKECFYTVNYSQDPNAKICTLCGNPLFDEPDDILLHRKYDIVKEIRPTQAKLSNDIYELMIRYNNAVLLGEGGTGIGKSFAYLIPAILQNKKVIISTAKKSLQRQLVNKDLPYLLSKMGVSRSFTIFKGVRNYACAKQMKRVTNKKFLAWMNERIEAKIPADLSDWPGDEPPWWDDISAENCIDGPSCTNYKRCRPHPKEHQIVIVNHSILAIDIFFRTQSDLAPFMNLLGPYDTVIIDEAHQAAEMFKHILSRRVSIGQVDRLLNMLENHPNVVNLVDTYSEPTKIVDLAANLKNSIKKVVTKIGYTGDSYRAVANIESVSEELLTAYNLSNKMAAALQRIITKVLVDADIRILLANFGGEEGLDEIRYFLNKLTKQNNTVLHTLSLMLEIPEIGHGALLVNGNCSIKTNDNWLLTANGKGLAVQPLELGPLLGPRLISIPYKVLLSATLRYDNSFDYIKSVLGIDPLTEQQKEQKYAQKEETYSSPFNYKEQARFYIPAYTEDGTPFPVPVNSGDDPVARDNWTSTVAHEIQRMIIGSKGDALVLCHSKADLEDITNQLNLNKLDSCGITIIKQEGDAGFAHDTFLTTPQSVLFGLKSFWEGIDIQGSKLRLVIIPKLPFPNKQDPVIVALTKRIGDRHRAFDKLFVPQMIFDIKQGKGRLIRSKTDKGAVAILDSRVLTTVKDPNRRARRLHEMETSTDPETRFPLGYGKKVIIEMAIPIRAKTFDDLIEFINS